MRRPCVKLGGFLMSYAVIHMQKFKAPDVKGMQIHNQREKESQTNADIDRSRTSQNYDVVNAEPIDYKKRIDREIEERYRGHRSVRKDAVRLCSFMVTSDKDFFDSLSPEDEKRFFEDSVEFLQDRYGKQNIIYAQVHKDEKTPHMHVGMVPMTEDGRMSAKHFFGHKNELQKLQTDFHAHVKDRGFDLERGEEGSEQKHVEPQKLKKQTLEKDIGDLESKLESHQEISDSVEGLTSRKKEKRSMSLSGAFSNDKVVQMSKEDYDNLVSLGSRAEYYRDRFKKHWAAHEQKDQKLEKSKARNEQLEHQVSDLRKENQVLKKENKLLHRSIENIKGQFKEHAKMISKVVGYAKTKAVQGLSKYPKSLFNEKDSYEQEGKQEFIQERKKTRKKEKHRGLEL